MINTFSWNLVIPFQNRLWETLLWSNITKFLLLWNAIRCQLSVDETKITQLKPFPSFLLITPIKPKNSPKKQEFCKNRRNILNWQLHRFLSLKNFKCFLLPTFDGCLKKFYCFRGNLSWSTISTYMGREFLPSLSPCPCKRPILVGLIWIMV